MQQVLQSGDFTLRNSGLIYSIGWKRLNQEWHDVQTHQCGTDVGIMSNVMPHLYILYSAGCTSIPYSVDEVTDPRTFW